MGKKKATADDKQIDSVCDYSLWNFQELFNKEMEFPIRDKKKNNNNNLSHYFLKLDLKKKTI